MFTDVYWAADKKRLLIIVAVVLFLVSFLSVADLSVKKKNNYEVWKLFSADKTYRDKNQNFFNQGRTQSNWKTLSELNSL